MKNLAKSFTLTVLLLTALLLASCASGTVPAPTEAPAPTPSASGALVPTATQAATPAPTSSPEPTSLPTQTAPSQCTSIILATTTSTENSGLLSFILPDFEQKTGIKVKVVAVGTGQALKLGEDGNADVLLVHAPALEEAFMAAGYGVDRQPVMYNDFIIVGPADDPAGIRGAGSAPEAFRRIAESQAVFVSRGDESGTHVKEKDIWKAAGITPAGDWYRSIGQGMGPTLTTAAEMRAYTLSDRATFLAMKAKGLALETLVEGDANLLNPYSVIAVNPQRYPQICYAGAQAFIQWITSLPTQELIASFGRDQFGQSIFFPDSLAWRQAHR